jgi:cytoskeletal protein CcmA (bactofilin family)
MTVIGPSIHITGDISGAEDVTIQGRLVGSLVLRDHALVIDRGARVDADVHGARVSVRGELNGAATATFRVELAPSCSVTGSLSATHVVVADGASFNGHIDMGQRTIAARLASYHPAQTP